jgi:cell shape-determining protein MreC
VSPVAVEGDDSGVLVGAGSPRLLPRRAQAPLRDTGRGDPAPTFGMASVELHDKIALVLASRFNGLIVFLLVTGLGSAFLLPPWAAQRVRGPFEGIFSPISIPVKAVASLATRRSEKPAVVDEVSPATPRRPGDVYSENSRLWDELAKLRIDNERLSQLVAEKKVVGDVGGGAESATVTGVDASGIRDGLLIAGANFPADKPVVHEHDLVGRIYGGGIAGAEVRLITDKGMGFTVKIGKYVRNADGTTSLKFVEHLTPLVQGMGHGQMEIRNTLSVAQAAEAHLEAGDIVLLDDREKWPAGVQGFKVGRIVSIKKQANAPLVADVLIEPEVDLLHLSSVLVLRGGEKK